MRTFGSTLVLGGLGAVLVALIANANLFGASTSSAVVAAELVLVWLLALALTYLIRPRRS